MEEVTETPDDQAMWVEVMCDPAENEVIVETDPVVLVSPIGSESIPDSQFVVVPPISYHSEDSISLDNSLFFQRQKPVQTITQLIGQETRTSFEHVNQIIKNSAAGLPCLPPVTPRQPPPSVVQRLSPSSLTSRKSNNVIKKVIVIQPGDDPEEVTAEAINRITETLNQEAANKIANGLTPDKETVIEITRINAPAERFVKATSSNPNPAECGTSMKSSLNHQFQPQTTVPKSPERPSMSSPERHKHHRRKSPHPKRYMYHTPSPPQAKSRTATSHSKRTAQNLSATCYFQSSSKQCSAAQSSVSLSSNPEQTTASSKLLGLNSLLNSNNQHKVCQSSNYLNCSISGQDHSLSQSLSSVSQFSTKSASQSKPSILRTGRQTSLEIGCGLLPGQESISTLSGQSLDVSSRASSCPPVPVLGVSVTVYDSESSQDSPSGDNKLNESLTNIQWLGAMSGDNLDKPGKSGHRDIRIIASEKQIEMISRECGRKKRPPYSYMHLIQMAICSTDDKKMTLKEIYRWIEEKFPYYKHCSNQGWKNSIRHNLSLYDIFVREKVASTQGKTGSSYWTLRADIPLKASKTLQHLVNGQLHGENSSQESYDSGFELSSIQYDDISPSSQGATGSKKKGPIPLLPKPPPMQTYALIPIQSGVPVLPSQPIMVSSEGNPSAGTSNPDLTRPHTRPASTTELLKRSHAKSVEIRRKANQPGSAFELLKSSSLPGSGSDIFKNIHRQRPSSACELLSGIEVRPEGLSTPPPQPSTSSEAGNDSRSKSNLKRHHSPTGSSGGSVQKHVQIAPSIDIYDDQTHTVRHQLMKNLNSTCTLSSSLITGSNNSTTDHLSLFADSGFVSDLSALETTSNQSGLPKPTMYLSLKGSDEGIESLLTNTISTDQGSTEKDKGIMLSIDSNSSQSGLHTILSSIEKSLSTPMRNLLQTPPKSADKSLFTSTPFRMSFGSPSWLSPIKGLTPIAGDPSLEGNLFTPLKEGKAVTSTPYRTDSPNNDCDRTPENTKQTVGHSMFPSLTPLKTPFKSPACKDGKGFSDRSPGDLFGLSNQSFSRLIGEFHLENMIDEGMNMDVSNMSFSAFQ